MDNSAQINTRIPNDLLARLSDFVNVNMGLYFTKDRWLDLLRGIKSAMTDFGFEDVEEGIRWLLANPLKKNQIEVLAAHLTVGETYFFREPKTFEALEKHIIPKIIRSRWQGDRRLRIWSAGCCSGEEAYSLSILLSRIIPDIHKWNITILATDINPVFLKKAQEGIYREWSFRGTPYWLKENYFKDRGNGFYEILPRYKNMVTFQYLNLVEDTFPSIYNDTNAMDLIFCRNVLMYFSTRQVEQIISRYHQSLLDEGWLVTASSETSHIFYSQYITVNFPGAILYKKGAVDNHSNLARIENQTSDYYAIPTMENHQSFTDSLKDLLQHNPNRPDLPTAPDQPEEEAKVIEETREEMDVCKNTLESAGELYKTGKYEAVIDILIAFCHREGEQPKAMTLIAKAFANLGKLNDALSWCQKALDMDKLNPTFHHLHAVILQEQGEVGKSMESLKRALYLNPDFVLPYFMLGNMHKQKGKLVEADKQFENALMILEQYDREELLPESEGLTAGRLKELIQLTMSKEMPA